MDPWSWIAIAAVVTVVVAVAEAFRRRRADTARAEEEKQLREARRWKAIESARAEGRDGTPLAVKARWADSDPR